MSSNQTIGFLGAGNMGQAVLHAFIDSNLISRENIFISGRDKNKLNDLAKKFQVNAVKNNEELIEKCSIIIIGVKPQDLDAAIKPLADHFTENHLVISLAAGISLASLQKLIPNAQKLMRIMPNTAAQIKQSVIAYVATAALKPEIKWLEKLLASMGLVIQLENDEKMETLVVGSSSGIGFVYELMIYWQNWFEKCGIDADTAKKITTQVFAGAAALSAAQADISFEEQLKKITSSKGVTAAGLESMRELKIEDALQTSFDKAAARDKELGQN